jgi:hypothetical protein
VSSCHPRNLRFGLPVILQSLRIDRTCGVSDPFPASNPSGIAPNRKGCCNSPTGGAADSLYDLTAEHVELITRIDLE